MILITCLANTGTMIQKNCDMPASLALPELPLNQDSKVNMLEKGLRSVNFMGIFHEIYKECLCQTE